MPLCPFSFKKTSTASACPVTGQSTTDLSKVRADLKQALKCRGHDDGSLAPLFIRFSWHCCATYDKVKNNGGSNGSTMRFAEEQSDPENKGLAKAREVLNKVHAQHPYMSLADIYVLAGYVAFEATGGPVIPFGIGRKDFTEQEAEEVYGRSLCPFGDGAQNPNGSRLPPADMGMDTSCATSCPLRVKEKPTIDAVRCTFDRMGLDDKETVALIIMGHQYGRMHPEVSGLSGKWWAFDPTRWNIYGSTRFGYLSTFATRASDGYEYLLENPSSNCKRLFKLTLGNSQIFTMIAADMALLWDPTYREITLQYEKNRSDFHQNSALAWKKLTELGCSNLVPESTPGHDRIRIEHLT